MVLPFAVCRQDEKLGERSAASEGVMPPYKVLPFEDRLPKGLMLPSKGMISSSDSMIEHDRYALFQGIMPLQ